MRSKTQERLRCQKRRSLPQPVKKPQNHFHEYRQKVTGTTLFQTAFHRIFQPLAQTAHVCFHEQKRVHTPPQPRTAHTRAHTAKQGRFGWGALLLPSERSARFGNPAWPGGRTANFAAFGSWLGGAPEERREPRNSDALMRVSVPRRRGPAGLRDLFRFCRNCGLYILRSGLSACARHGRYHYPRRALRAVETPGGRLSKRLTCRFLRSGGRSSPHDFYFLANTQNFLLAVPVANTFALWYDKFSKLEID